MGFLDFFKTVKPNIMRGFTRWNELGVYTAVFSGFGTNIYKSDIVRACVRPLAEHTSKANAKCTDKNIERILNLSPNIYMNGKDFLTKVRTKLELKNTCFIYIHRDDKGKATGFYPVPFASFEALQYNNGLFIKFLFNGESARSLVLPWADLVALRKDYNESDIAGDDNTAILPLLELINTTNQGVSNAVKATANLRGILKSTKAMLSPEDIKKQKDNFVKDYLSLENEGGIASLDATQEFTPIKMEPVITSYEQMHEFRENVYRYFGVSDAIIKSDYTESQFESFYDSRIEPFLVALSLELTRKVFTEREIGFGNAITYESNRLQYSNTSTKLSFIQLVDRGMMTPNEYRMLFNLAQIEGGDTPIRMLNMAEVSAEQTEALLNESENEDD